MSSMYDYDMYMIEVGNVMTEEVFMAVFTPSMAASPQKYMYGSLAMVISVKYWKHKNILTFFHALF